MNTDTVINTYIDTLGIRCVCDGKHQRDSLFNTLILFLKERKTVGIKYNKERSNEYYQVTDLLYSNTRLASIAKGYYTNGYNMDYYYINISFYGLKRYNNKKDEASMLLTKTITAFLNTYNINFRLTELDIAMDMKSKIDNLLVVCTSRSPNINYHKLGDIDTDGTNIQANKGTYYIENLKSSKQKKNAMSRAYLYDKRLKERSKYNRDIGFDLTRFEVKLQKRYFVKNEFGVIPIYKSLNKYTVLHFTDIEQKKLLIQQLNNAKTSRTRRDAIEAALSNNKAILLTRKMNKVGSFLREIDTIKFDTKENFIYTKHEDYLECMSKLNRNHHT